MLRTLVLAFALLGAGAVPAAATVSTSGALVYGGCYSHQPFCAQTLTGDPIAVDQAPSSGEIYVDSYDYDTESNYLFATHLDAGGRIVRDACLADAAARGCTVDPRIKRWAARAWTSDGATAYALSADDDGTIITVLARDPTTNALAQTGCYGPAPPCLPLRDTDGRITQLVVSPDGREVYALAAHAIDVYARDPATGALTSVQCLEHDAAAGAPCASYRGGSLDPDHGLALTPDATQLVIAGEGFAALGRDPQSGLLSQAPTGTGVCATRGGVDGCAAVAKAARFGGSGVPAFTADGTAMFLPNPHTSGIDAYRRDPASGTITEIGEVRGPTSSPTATVLVAPDQRNVYGTFNDNGNTHYGAAIDFYALSPGGITPLPAPYACQGSYPRLECGGQVGIARAIRGLLITADGRYLLSGGFELGVLRRTLAPAPTVAFRGVPPRCTGDFTVHVTIKGQASRRFTARFFADNHLLATTKARSFDVRVRAKRLIQHREDFLIGKHILEVRTVDAAGNRNGVERFVRFGTPPRHRGC